MISISRDVCGVCIPSSKDSFSLKVFPKSITAHASLALILCGNNFVPCKLSSELIRRPLSCFCCNLHTNNRFLASRLEFFCVRYILCHCDQVSTESHSSDSIQLLNPPFTFLLENKAHSTDTNMKYNCIRLN